MYLKIQKVFFFIPFFFRNSQRKYLLRHSDVSQFTFIHCRCQHYGTKKTNMIRLIKGLCFMLSLSLAVTTLTFLLNACQEDSNNQTCINTQNANDFFAICAKQKNELFKASVKERHPNFRSTSNIGVSGNDGGLDGTPSPKRDSLHHTVYITPPDDFLGRLPQERIQAISTLEDIIRLEHEFAITFSTIKGPGAEDSIVVSVEETKAALNPILARSKEYLYKKGFNKTEIQKMIKEENATEEDLIALVMLISSDESQATAYSSAGQPFSPFAVPCYAAFTKSDLAIISNCALRAIGADIIQALCLQKGTVWAKPLIKKAFKTVAKRMLGPIGVGIAVVEFSVCIANAYI